MVDDSDLLNEIESEYKDCIKCGQPIAKLAYFCPHCKFSQMSCVDC